MRVKSRFLSHPPHTSLIRASRGFAVQNESVVSLGPCVAVFPSCLEGAEVLGRPHTHPKGPPGTQRVLLQEKTYLPRNAIACVDGHLDETALQREDLGIVEVGSSSK